MTEDQLIARYGDLLVNTGGNDPAELLHRLDTEKHLAATNVVVFTLATAVRSQLRLLANLRQAGLLPDHA